MKAAKPFHSPKADAASSWEERRQTLKPIGPISARKALWKNQIKNLKELTECH
jgi:hypothetical protein